MEANQNAITSRVDGIRDNIGDFLLRLNVTYYDGTQTTLSSLIRGFSYPFLCVTNTEKISDKPSGKYGTVVIYAPNNNRISIQCHCTDNTVWGRAYDASSETLTGWKEL